MADLPPGLQRAISDLKADIAFVEGFGNRDGGQLIEPLIRLGTAYLTAGMQREAERVSRRALEIAKSERGEEHPNVAQSLNNLASAPEAQGEYIEAEAIHREALAKRRELLGDVHPDVAESLNNLAETLLEQGKYAEAKPLAERALAIQEKALRPGHPDFANTLDTLAGIHDGLDDKEKAKEYSERAAAGDPGEERVAGGTNSPPSHVGAPARPQGRISWGCPMAYSSVQKCTRPPTPDTPPR